MKRISCFCIPAHGHTNPMLPVVKVLVNRGNLVRFYSFDEFRERVERTGAEFVSCERFLPRLSSEQLSSIMKVSATEMTIQDIRTTRNMDDFLAGELTSFRPDVIYTDSVCFWGKLTARKYQIPMVVSTSTFAFNQLSSQYMKSSPREMADVIFGLPKISRELKSLEPHGYHVKSALALVQSDNETDSVVYTSRRFQPYAQTFSEHYAFVGPSLFTGSPARPEGTAAEKKRPLVYISLGTVINDRPDFYERCIESLKGSGADVIISCGKYLDADKLGALPDTIRVSPSVNQLEVLSRADVFITHCGMNSVSESLFSAVPMVLYPQTNEQHAVARRTVEVGAGLLLKDDSVEGIRHAVQCVLKDESYAKAAQECSRDFRACAGPAGAAEFIEGAPHASTGGTDVIKEMNRESAIWNITYSAIAAAAMILAGAIFKANFWWVIGIVTGLVNQPFTRAVQRRFLRRHL
ncbi:MAG: macrolide family glycosyltransferase [Olsenella sp.]